MVPQHDFHGFPSLQRIQSPRPTSARTTAGRNFVFDRSEKGKRTSTTRSSSRRGVQWRYVRRSYNGRLYDTSSSS